MTGHYTHNAHTARFEEHYTIVRDDFPDIPRVVLGERSVDGTEIRKTLQNFTSAEIDTAKQRDFACDLACCHLDDLSLILCEQPHPEDNNTPDCECKLQLAL